MRRAIVMAGGQGSRLRPLTHVRPKPLVPVTNRPVLTTILQWLRRHGVTEVLLTLHYRAEEIRRAFGDGREFGLRLAYHVEEAPLGTAGAVKQAEEWIAGQPFLVVSGDALTDLDLSFLIERHRERGAWLTLGLKEVTDPSAYGVVAVDDRGRVRRFQEKPAPGEAFSSLVNTGIYCVAPPVLREVPSGAACDWSRDVFPRLLARERPLFACLPDGYWCDIGSLDDYRRGQRDALAGRVQVALPGVELGPGVRVEQGARIAPGAVIAGPALLGAGCRIEPGAWVLPDSIIGAGAVVHPGAVVAGAVVGARCQVGARAVLQECILDEDVRAGTGCRVSRGAVVGRGCRLAAGARVGDGWRIDPDHVLLAASGVAAAPGTDGAKSPSRHRRRRVLV